MIEQVPLLNACFTALRGRFTAGISARRARRDAGYTTEAIIATALLAGIAIAAVTALGGKVLAKAAGIELG